MKTKLVFFLILCSLNLFSQIPTNGLQAYFPLNGNANDSSGNGFNGTLNGQIPDTGVCSQAYWFLNNSIDCGDPAGDEFELVNDATISLWVKLKGIPSSYYTLIGKDVSAGNNQKKWFVAIQSNRVVFHINGTGMGGGYWKYSDLFTFNLNVFYHIVITKSANTYQFFIDTVSAGTQTFSVNVFDVPAPLRIGRNEFASVNAVIDEVLLYNRVLTQQEINQLYISCNLGGMSAAFQSDETAVCPGTCTGFSNLSFNATTFQWSFPGGTPASSTELHPQNICYNTPGMYDVTLVAGNGIESDTLIMNNYIQVYPYSPSQGIQQNGSTLIASNLQFTSYQWLLNGNTISGATSTTYNSTLPGTYSVVCLDSNGCSVEAVIHVIGIEEIGKNINVKIFPNPADAYFTIACSTNSFTQAHIFNLQGEKIYSCNIPGNQVMVSCQNFNPGIYLIKLESEDGFGIQKLVVQ